MDCITYKYISLLCIDAVGVLFLQRTKYFGLDIRITECVEDWI